MKQTKKVCSILVILAIILIIFDLPNPPSIDTKLFGIHIKKDFKTRLGLDLAGGTQLTLEADMATIPQADRKDSLESAKQVIERRVNFFGVSEPMIQSAISGELHRIIVELPGVTNTDEAIALVGQTAQLEFRELINPEGASISATLPVGITGADLKKSNLQFNPQTGEPEVSIQFTPDGAKKFADVTKRLINKPLAIFLDGIVVTAPRVNSEITDGQAVITGSFTVDAAKQLAIQLNAGALPVPVKIVERRTVGATLGADSVTKSVRAGMIGLGLVAAFMIVQYGWLGFLADIALLMYGLITLFLYRFIPVTLTLPGIAGFILSIGMAVDSNILIFSRYKEELRRGKPWQIAIELGFGKAWESIRDANFTTIITSIILFNPGNWSFLPTSGLVRGFAATLFLGVVTSLFTGIVVTRTLIRMFYRGGKQ